MRTKGWRLIYSFAAVAVLISSLAGCGKSGARRGGSVERAAEASPAVEPPVRTLPPLPARTLSPRLEAERARAAAEAERLRGLHWLAPVGMTELSGWEYGTRTRELADVLGADDLKAVSRLAVAGGILPEGTDLAALASTFTAVAADATYSPLDKQVLLVSGGEAKPTARRHSLLTHEHVHALQDQHFDLLRMLLARPYNFDRTEAAFAVVEGDAVNVQRRLEEGDASFARRTLEDIRRQEDARFVTARRTVGALFPPLLTETYFFRYRDGSRFVEAVRRARAGGSQSGADELFRRPPASTEQVLHPEKYLAGDEPREAALDEASFASEGWRAPASTPLGEIGVRGLLMAGVPAAEAERAAAGWGGDRAYVFEREGSTPLFAWQTLWDKTADAQEFFRAYNSLLQRRGARAETGGQERDAASAARVVVWREGPLVVLVRLRADSVLVLRGAEADVAAAARLVGAS